METATGVVYYVRQSRTKPGLETVHVTVDSVDGWDDRVFAFRTEPGTYRKGDEVTLEIEDVSATIKIT